MTPEPDSLPISGADVTPPLPIQRERGGCLTLFLGGNLFVVAPLNLLATIFVLSDASGRAADQVLFNFVYSIPILIGLIGIWCWKRWGVWLAYGGQLVAIVVGLSLGDGTVLLRVIPMIVLACLLPRVWDHLE